jgi:hypothetical protein
MRIPTIIRPAVWIAVIGAVASCKQGPSPEVQARIDSLTRVAGERDQMMTEMAQNARLLSDISADLSKVQMKTKLKVSSESPAEASRDTIRQRVRYIATRLNETESKLRASEREVSGLSHLSDSLRVTLQATIANYDSVIASQRSQLADLAAQVDTLRGQTVALRDTVSNLTTYENTVYYVIGTKDELVQKGLIQEEGGSRFLWILWKSGETVVPSRQLDPSQFTAIDRREVTRIALPDSSKTYRIASRQDLSSLATPPDKDGAVKGALEIAAPDRFWSPSKYLIIVQS